MTNPAIETLAIAVYESRVRSMAGALDVALIAIESWDQLRPQGRAIWRQEARRLCAEDET